MNAFVDAIEGRNAPALTLNGAETLATTGSKAVDLFAIIGAPTDLPATVRLFGEAFSENKDLAARVALWSRDIREGAGRRQVFREILQYLEKNDFDAFSRVLVKVPELGRWDDVLVAQTPAGRKLAFTMIAKALSEENGLCAKWMPRQATKTDSTAVELREFLGLTPKQYRKLLVRLTNVVEQKMCAKQFDEINYSHVPSVAGARYAKAFRKRDTERYEAWLESLKKDPKAKVNTGALYPHDLHRTAVYGGQESFAEEAWKRLPDYVPADTRLLPLVDVSGSMCTSVSGNIQAIDVSVSLGLYLAERNKSAFANKAITFSSNPSWISVNPKTSLKSRFNTIRGAEWGMSTNLEAAFELILNTAVKNKVPHSDMPTHLLVLSDMEFNQCTEGFGRTRLGGSPRSENFANIEQQYRAAGYERPQIIFWNLNCRSNNNPVSKDENGTVLVSGFSPAILKTVLTQKNVTPLEAMLETVGKDRYAIY